MQTLYDQLKPELLINLENNTAEYSESVTRIKKILKSNSFYSELTMGEVESIGTFCEVDTAYVSMFMYRFGEHLFIKK